MLTLRAPSPILAWHALDRRSRARVVRRVRVGLTLARPMATTLRADLSGPAAVVRPAASPTARTSRSSWTSRAYDFGFARGRRDRADGLVSTPEAAVAGSDLDRDGPALGMSPADVERLKERIRAGYLPRPLT